MQQAQGAIDAARAAGADRYAQRRVHSAAQDALKNAQDAVAQRDYRLALNYALDSRERAQNAATRGGRPEGRRAHRSANARSRRRRQRLRDAKAKLRSIEGAAHAREAHAAERRTIADAETAVQEARAAFASGDYLDVIER